jgi:hypothetical protein
MALLIPTPDPKNPRSVFLDCSGRYRTQSLFWEYKDSGYPALFNLREEDTTDADGNTYVSLRRLYVQTEDPTEYLFALKAFGSWRHWSRLRSLLWFLPHYTEWREELDARLRSIGAQALMESATGRRAVKDTSAARYLSNGLYWSKIPKRGRPSSEEVEGERKRIAQLSLDTDEDYDRAIRPPLVKP